MRIARIAAGLFLLAYLIFLFRHTCFFASGPDSSGYLNEATLFAEGKLKVRVAPLRELGLDRSMIDVFVPLGFLPGEGELMVPTYPPGLPLHMLLFGKLGAGLYVVSPLAAIGCLLMLYAVARELGLSRGWAMIAPLLLMSVAVFLAFALQPMSDVLATFWVLLAIWCALRARRSGGAAYAAGAAMAMAVVVRPTNALAVVAFALALPVRMWTKAILGAIVPAAALFSYNAIQYGSPFRFGFASVADVLTWRPFGVCGGFHLWWTMRQLTPVVAVLAIAMLVLRSVPLRQKLMLASWFAAFFVFYSFYNYCPDWNAIRFLLPTFPALILGALLMLQRIPRVAAVVAVLAILYGQSDLTSGFRVFRVDDDQSVFPETIGWAERRLPPNALVVTGVFSGAYDFYSR
ncbi:MAG: glycosyltransferase family 39 protein [Thermoanaerobaculia bacterium]